MGHSSSKDQKNSEIQSEAPPMQTSKSHHNLFTFACSSSSQINPEELSAKKPKYKGKNNTIIEKKKHFIKVLEQETKDNQQMILQRNASKNALLVLGKQKI
jgi:hypothetical protein